jgi:hypothetical protein
MSAYALINQASRIVENIVEWDGESEWQSPEGFLVVETTTALIGWTYADGEFSPPPVVPPTDAEIMETNLSRQAVLLAEAAQAMTPLLLALQLGNATSKEIASAEAWQMYHRALLSTDVNAEMPEWPDHPA